MLGDLVVPASVSNKLLPGVGLALLALATVAMITDHDALSGSFALLAVLVFLAAAFGPRISGEVSAGLLGFRFQVVQEIARSAPSAGLSRDELVAAIESASQLDKKSVRALVAESPDVRADDEPGPKQVPPKSVEGEISLTDAGVIEVVAEHVIASAKEAGNS